MQKASLPVRRLLALLFAAGLLILLDQSADLAATVLAGKTDISAPAWRFGLFGMVASRTSVLLVADVMLFASATALEWRNVLRALGAVHLMLAAGALVGLVLFMLDAAQVWGAVPAQSRSTFSAAAFRAGVVVFAGAITFAWAGLAAWRSAGTRPRSGRPASESLLVVEKKAGPEA